MSCKYCRSGVMKRRKPHAISLRALTGDQAASLVASLQGDHIHQDLKDAVTLVLNTGMRVGELRELRWKDVNSENRNITLYGRTLSQHVRRIPYNAVVAEMFERRRSSSPSSEYVFKAASPRSLSREPRELKELGQRVLGRVVTFHDLRHTFFTTLVNNGADIPTLMSIGGWRSYLMPLKFLYATPAYVKAVYEAAMKVLQK